MDLAGQGAEFTLCGGFELLAQVSSTPTLIWVRFVSRCFAIWCLQQGLSLDIVHRIPRAQKYSVFSHLVKTAHEDYVLNK